MLGIRRPRVWPRRLPACTASTAGRSPRSVAGGESPADLFDTVYGMTLPGAYVGMTYQRYREIYRALALLAISNRTSRSSMTERS